MVGESGPPSFLGGDPAVNLRRLRRSNDISDGMNTRRGKFRGFSEPRHRFDLDVECPQSLSFRRILGCFGSHNSPKEGQADGEAISADRAFKVPGTSR